MHTRSSPGAHTPPASIKALGEYAGAGRARSAGARAGFGPSSFFADPGDARFTPTLERLPPSRAAVRSMFR